MAFKSPSAWSTGVTITGATFTTDPPPWEHLVIRSDEEPATEKQVDYLTGLMKGRECDVDPNEVDLIVTTWVDSGVLTKAYASTLIEQYRALPKRARRRLAPGYYTTHDGDTTTLYTVVENKAGTGTYLKKLLKDPETNRWSWNYSPTRVVSHDDLVPLTTAEAATFGHLHGFCFRCLRPLTSPASVTLGYGPHCAKVLKDA